MSDRDRLLELLRSRGPRGATTLEIRRFGLSGNPSQRRAELIDRGFQIDVKPYREGRRNGRLYVLISEPAGLGAGQEGDDNKPSAQPGGNADLGATARFGGAAGAEVGAGECSQTRAPASSDETNDGHFPSGGEGSGLFDAEQFKRQLKHDQIEDAA